MSALYQTEPLTASGAAPARRLPGQLPVYFNAACSLRTRLGPHQLLRCLQTLERGAGRARRDDDRFFAWGPRPLDLDLLAFGGVTLAHRRLALPHPAWAERAFVLRPLLDLGVARLSSTGPSCAQRLAALPGYHGGRVAARQLSWVNF